MSERADHAVQRLEAAIAKLERLRDEAFPGTWRVLTSGIERGDHWYVAADDESILSISANDGADEGFRRPTAVLLVTLHRTIDAQLAILRAGLPYGAPLTTELALADAILGDNS